MRKEPAAARTHAWNERAIGIVFDERVILQVGVVLLHNVAQFRGHASLPIQHGVRNPVPNQSLKKGDVEVERLTSESGDVALRRELLVVTDEYQLVQAREQRRGNVGLPGLSGFLNQKGSCSGGCQEAAIFRKTSGGASDDIDAVVLNDCEIVDPSVDFLLLCVTDILLEDLEKLGRRSFLQLGLKNLVYAPT